MSLWLLRHGVVGRVVVGEVVVVGGLLSVESIGTAHHQGLVP